MFTRHRAAVFAFGLLLCCVAPLLAAESVGKAVHIKTAVTGASGELAVNDVVYQDERIRTSISGLGQFVFRDGTKLAVGWGSSVVIDKFVYDGSRSVKKLTIKAAKGTFRWISGNSKHAAYEILTPAGTIGVRGTVFDFYVGADGTTAVVLLSGSANFCGSGGCRELTRPCDSVVAKRNGNVTDTRRVDRSIFKTLGNTKALPFLSGSQRLSATGGGGCGLAKAVAIQQDLAAPPRAKEKQVTPTRPDRKVEPNDDRSRSERDRRHDDHDRGLNRPERHDDEGDHEEDDEGDRQEDDDDENPREDRDTHEEDRDTHE